MNLDLLQTCPCAISQLLQLLVVHLSLTQRPTSKETPETQQPALCFLLAMKVIPIHCRKIIWRFRKICIKSTPRPRLPGVFVHIHIDM